jgi:hypothetical protein
LHFSVSKTLIKVRNYKHRENAKDLNFEKGGPGFGKELLDRG